MVSYSDYRFSITVYADDLAVLGCLRALAFYAQDTGNRQVSWGGTKKEHWQAADKCVTFRFTSIEYRQRFLDEAKRLLPRDLWRRITVCDDDPAKRARER